jgi:hypothetical protein
VIIDDLDVLGARPSPPEAYAPLVIDPDAVLACAIGLESFAPVTHP